MRRFAYGSEDEWQSEGTPSRRSGKVVDEEEVATAQAWSRAADAASGMVDGGTNARSSGKVEDPDEAPLGARRRW